MILLLLPQLHLVARLRPRMLGVVEKSTVRMPQQMRGVNLGAESGNMLIDDDDLLLYCIFVNI